MNQEQKRIMQLSDVEDQHSMVVWKPLYEAERQRLDIKRRKEYLEQLNMNFVSTGIFPNLDPIRHWEGKWADWREWSDANTSNNHMGYNDLK